MDVRGGTLRESLRTLKSEYYKLAAALLECGLDDLLQRNSMHHWESLVFSEQTEIK